MASPVYTYFGAILVVNTVDVSNDTVNFTMQSEVSVPEIAVYGTDQYRAAAGANKWSGEIECVYDYASSASTAYRLLLAELQSPTTGGLGCIFKPTGEGAGEEERTVYVVLKGMQHGDTAENIQTVTFPYTVNGQPGFATQTT
jgi:hypothetical protein